MKYMLQVRFNGADTVIGRLPAEEQQNVHAEFEAIRQSSGVLDGNQLQAASTAATVRVDGGQTQVTEGPAVEAGTELDGYYIYDAPDLAAQPLVVPEVAPDPVHHPPSPLAQAK